MSKNITIDVYFEVVCDDCKNSLVATYNERLRLLEVEPCRQCMEQKEEEALEEYKKGVMQ